MNPWWTRRSVTWFFMIGFGVPWLGWTLIALTGVSDSPLATALFYTGDFMTVGGFIAAYVAAGRPGLVSLVKRCFQVAAPAPWMLFALFLPFVWIGLAFLTYGATHGGVGRIVPAGLLSYVTGSGQLLALTTGPLGEEAGWRGFLLPRLLGRYPPIVASLILGLFWSIWHYPLYYNQAFATVGGTVSFTFAILCYSVLLTVLWAHTRASVFWVIIFHWTINVTENVVRAVFPDLNPPRELTAWLTTGSVAIIAVIVIAVVGPRRLREKVAEARGRLADERVDGPG